MLLRFVSFVSFPTSIRSSNYRFNFHRVPREATHPHYPVCVGKSLDEAIQKGFVEDFGRVVKLSPDGYFPCSNNLHIAEHLRPHLGKIIDNVWDAIGRKHVKAIFLRGSVATGFFSAKRDSDLDLVLILGRQISREDKSKLNASISKTAKAFFGLSHADIRYICLHSWRLREAESSIDTSTLILLRSYAVCLYSSDPVLFSENIKTKSTGDGALDIRADERWFLRLFEKASVTNQTVMQCSAINWICKRTLRAIADLASTSLKEHSRDLIPCYRLASRAFPDHKALLILGLQFACGDVRTGYLGLSQSGFITEGYEIARDMVELAEELSLRQNFGPAVQHSINTHLIAYPRTAPSNPWLHEAKELMAGAVAQVKSVLGVRKARFEELKFLHSKLPEIPLSPQPILERKCRVATTESEIENSPSRFLEKCDEPVVFREVISTERESPSQSVQIMKDFSASVEKVQCRVSPGSEFTFCRGSHPWIDSGRFSPPSILLTTSVQDAMARMNQGAGLPTLRYGEGERVYIQSRVWRKKRMFRGLDILPIRIAQEERIWASTHGTISGLHFDASYSGLLQRCGSKRMIFFPPQCLEQMGIYPLGHPLHRRARVNLSRPKSRLFREFWELCADEAGEVVLESGDLVVFPPFWSHYTESLTANNRELSISHTLRYV